MLNRYAYVMVFLRGKQFGNLNKQRRVTEAKFSEWRYSKYVDINNGEDNLLKWNKYFGNVT